MDDDKGVWSELFGGDRASVRCKTQGCPVKVTYQEILAEEPHGWLLVVDNLLVWLEKEQTQLNRVDQTVKVKLCDACEKGLVE